MPDPQKYLQPLEARIEEDSEPLVDYYGANNRQKGLHNNMFNLNNESDDEELVDDSDDDN